MPLSFPSNPSLNQTSTQNGRVYRWSGSAWEFQTATSPNVLAWTSAPASATATGTAGQIAYDARYLYVATSANKWKRTPLVSWAADQYFSNVSILLQGNGSTGDSGPNEVVGTANGVTANGSPKWGSGSLVFDGSAQLVFPADSAWNFPGDFTVESWIYLTASIGSGAYSEYAIAGQWSGSGGLCWLWYLKPDGFSVVLGNGSPVVGYDNRGGVSITANQWHHVALVRSNGVLSSYLNGSRFGTYSSSIDLSGNGPLTIGDQAASVVRPFFGRIDDFRITKGIARYTGDTYTVPAAEFS